MTEDTKKPLIMPLLPAADYISEGQKVYKAGGVIVYPTESYYALGVDPYNEDAVNRLYTLKGRPANKPFPIIVSDIAMLETVAMELSAVTRVIIDRHWPGPLTIIIKAKETLPPRLTAGTGAVAVRIPGCTAARALVEAIGTPLTATSANPSGRQAANTPRMVTAYSAATSLRLNDLDMIIDSGKLPGGLPSTIIDLRAGQPILIREGLIPFSNISE